MSEVSQKVNIDYPDETKRTADLFQSKRGIGEYSYFMGFENTQDFLNHIPNSALILDCGSGYGLLAKELSVLRPDVTTVSLNPAFIKSDFRASQQDDFFQMGEDLKKEHSLAWGIVRFTPEEITKAQNIHDKFRIAGYNPKLPFKPDSFDVVLDNFSSVNYSPYKEEINMIDELLRVLKKGGFAAMGPVYLRKWAEKIGDTLKTRGGLDVELKHFYFDRFSREMDKKSTAFHIRKI